MKFTLVSPPNPDNTGTFRPPVALATMAAVCRDRGHEPLIYDFEAMKLTSATEMAELLLADEPDVVGFSCMTPRYPIAVRTAEEIKKRSPETVVVMGGVHISGDPEGSLRSPAIDYIVVGEGEYPTVELLDALEQGLSTDDIPNVGRMIDGVPHIQPVRPFIADLDELPFPAYDLLPLDLYLDDELFIDRYMGVMTSRGCAWNCIFCASNTIWKRKVRFHSAKRVVDELEELVTRFGIREFYFYDDNFTVNRKRTLAICDDIIRRGLNIRFFIALRADTTDFEVVTALKNAGCFIAWLGVESGDDEILKVIGKGVTREHIIAASDVLREVGLPFFASYIFGHPGDTEETIERTMEVARRVDANYSKFFIAIPYPGTKLHALAVERELIVPDDSRDLSRYHTYQNVVANFSTLSDEELMARQTSAYEEFDLRKKPVAPPTSHPNQAQK
ncbi:B12-binding domain-containing radical SAM protein [uncultured Pseudodesulfovibrio sp.]|uniref:B12-binding domain-containing radical SAM protein n=1 Tax=uncultured Pseudodesulfovibrio sp. TaxID=2035858 RepID=UPI0029C6D936|nr:radical SAM protein [uncultured Pseudodesulfovibrio sp.]